MSNQFIPEPEEQHPLDWLKESSHLTYNHHSPFSDLSKDHFLDDLLKPNYLPASTSRHRNRGKVNSKNYRQKKKGQAEQTKRQVESLERQNQYLKSQKYCRWCQRPFDPPVLIEKQGLELPAFQNKQTFYEKQEKFEVEAEFERPKLVEDQKLERRGKVWIALGMLMLILGLTIHGLHGNCTGIKEIEIKRAEVERWRQQLNSMDEEYLEVKMRVRDEQPSLGKVDPGQLRIVYKTEEGEKAVRKEEKVSINKELLLGIQAQLDDVGFYL